MKILLLLLVLLSIKGFAQEATVEVKTDYFKNGKLHLVNSSHQDIAWVNSVDACIKDRADNIMLSVLKRMAEDKYFCYSIESAMYLEEFLEMYPEKYNEVLKYTQEGRLEWGATYSQPYQGMYEGEALIRQNYLGRKLLKKILPGCDFKAAWNVDVPGLSLQFPQIMLKSGIPYYNTSRFTTGFYEWFSPDNSSIKVISTGQYSGYSHQFFITKNDEELVSAFKNVINQWGDYQEKRGIAPACLALLSQDASKPVDYNNVLTKWNDSRNRERNNSLLPLMQYSTSTMFFDHLVSNPKAKFDIVRGERPNMWLYIHGPSHYESVSAARKSSRTLVAAETFSAINSVLNSNWNLYPTELFSNAWRNAIYADHGWGGYDGVTTDRLFKMKFEAALDTASSILQTSLRGISDLIQYDKNKSYAITVFNSVSWDRSDPVQVTINVEGRAHNHFKLVDEKGNSIPFQFTDSSIPTQKGNNELLSFVFVSENVPSMGYKTYYLVDDNENKSGMQRNSLVDIMNYENEFYKIKLGKGGINSLYDKDLKCEIFDTSNFKGAELFTVKSVGTGAGEFSDVQQPTLEGFDKLSNYSSAWNCIESGSVRDIFQTSAQFKDTKANLRIIVYKEIKKIDIEIDLNAYMGENWREYRLAFPLSKDYKDVIYDVPMGVLQVGKDEMEGMAGHKDLQPAYDVICKKVHPRELQDWFGAYGNNKGITIGSDVAVFDWVNIVDSLSSSHVLQPVLISNRKSCHGEGNYYLQAGNHTFHFSLNSYEGNWKNGYKNGMQKNRPLYTVVKEKKDMKAGTYPSTFSFAQLEGEDVIVSALKKCEDDNSIIIRYYDISGKEQKTSFSFFEKLNKVQHTNMIEEDGKQTFSTENKFSYPLGKYSIETFKLNVK